MPIYEYECGACGHRADEMQKMSAAPLTDCPACGKPSYSKQLSAAGFQLKGSGWYATDFKSGGNKKPAEASPASTAAPAAAATATTAAEPAAASSAHACGTGGCGSCA